MDALARNTDPQTSHDAAATVDLAPLQEAVVSVLDRRGVTGATTLEIANSTGLPRVSVSPRMKPLEGAGLVFRTSRRRGGGVVWVSKKGAANCLDLVEAA